MLVAELRTRLRSSTNKLLHIGSSFITYILAKKSTFAKPSLQICHDTIRIVNDVRAFAAGAAAGSAAANLIEPR